MQVGEQSKISKARSRAQAREAWGRNYMEKRKEWQVPSGDGTPRTWTQKETILLCWGKTENKSETKGFEHWLSRKETWKVRKATIAVLVRHCLQGSGVAEGEATGK